MTTDLLGIAQHRFADARPGRSGWYDRGTVGYPGDLARRACVRGGGPHGPEHRVPPVLAVVGRPPRAVERTERKAVGSVDRALSVLLAGAAASREFGLVTSPAPNQGEEPQIVWLARRPWFAA